MRPAILHWKVSLALVGVVILAVILGSALRTKPPPGVQYFASDPPHIRATILESGRVFPLNTKEGRKQAARFCVLLQLNPSAPKAALRDFCAKHRTR